jgi:hypothetical protein
MKPAAEMLGIQQQLFSKRDPASMSDGYLYWYSRDAKQFGCNQAMGPVAEEEIPMSPDADGHLIIFSAGSSTLLGADLLSTFIAILLNRLEECLDVAEPLLDLIGISATPKCLAVTDPIKKAAVEIGILPTSPVYANLFHRYIDIQVFEVLDGEVPVPVHYAPLEFLQAELVPRAMLYRCGIDPKHLIDVNAQPSDLSQGRTESDREFPLRKSSEPSCRSQTVQEKYTGWAQAAQLSAGTFPDLRPQPRFRFVGLTSLNLWCHSSIPRQKNDALKRSRAYREARPGASANCVLPPANADP